jgi:hypothetical protein
MTLRPLNDTVHVRGVDGPEYKVGPVCSNPTCNSWSGHAHHIFSRQQLGGPYAWVDVRGYVVQNLTGLCPDCHDDVSSPVGGHKAAIRMLGPEYDWVFTWCRVIGEHADGKVAYEPVGPIGPQPLTPEALALSRASGPSPESDACPTCGHVKRARSTPAGHGRARKSWTILVPDDARETGADVLDALVDDIALLLGIEPNQTGRYFVIVPSLYFVHQERERFIENLKGVGG